VVASYFLNSQSRIALGAANSSHLGNDLMAKILLIIFALIVAISSIACINRKSNFKVLFQNKNLLKLAPVTFFVLFNALPAIIQSRRNIPMINSYYSVMQVGNTFPNFIDLKQTIGFLINENVKNIGDNGLIYPTFILNFRFLNPFLESNFALGIIACTTIMLFAWMILDFSLKLSGAQNAGLTLLVVSPPFLLLLDRQNVDCLLILLLYKSASIYGKSDLKSTFAIVLIMLASLIKIYPIIILGFIFITCRETLIKVFSLLAMLVATFLIYPDLSSIQLFQITDMAGSAGLPVLMAHLAGSMSAGFYLSQSFFLFCILLMLIQFYSKDSTNVDWALSERRSIFVIFGSLILVETLILSTNYIYRLSYILFLIPLIGSLPKKSFSYISFLFFILSIYLSPRSTGLLMNLFLFPFLILLLLFVLKTMNPLSFKTDFHRSYMPNKTNN
jgi:hypothetical protein